MTDVPVRLCCGMRHYGAVCPDGKVMCQLCFRRVEMSALYVDEQNGPWDVCRDCVEREKQTPTTPG